MGITSLKGLDNYKLTFEAKANNTQGNNNIIGFAYKDSNYYSIYYVSQNSSDYTAITENQGSDVNVGNVTHSKSDWITYEVIVQNGQVTFKASQNDTQIFSYTRTPSRSITSNTLFGITTLWWNGVKTYIKNIKVESI